MPYYIYIVVSVVVCVLFAFVGYKEYTTEEIKYYILRIVYPRNGALPLPFMSHLWFIMPYLLITCSFFLQRKFADRVNRWLYMVVLLIGCIVSQFIGKSLLSELMVYNFFFMAGRFFYKKLSTKQIALVLVVAVITQVSGMYIVGMSFVPMQSHKFPPNLIFLNYGIIAISALGLVFSKIKFKKNKVLDVWNTNGFTIYLYQNYVYMVYVTFIPKLLIGYPCPLKSVVAVVFIFVLSTLVSFATSPMEKRIMKLFNW